VRRLSFVVSLVGVLLAVTASAALPFVATITSAEQGKEIKVNITREDCPRNLLGGCRSGTSPDPAMDADSVHLILRSLANNIPLGDFPAVCTSNCYPARGDASSWKGPTIAASGAPWSVACNGRHQLRVIVEGAEEAITFLNFLQPPPAPAGVAANGGVGDVTISWTPTSVVDVFAVAVARQSAAQAASGAWTSLTPEQLLDPADSSFHDTTVKASDLPVSYRVAFVRHDGKKAGGSGWVDGCADGDTPWEDVFAAQTLSVTDVAGNVTAPEPSPGPSETGTGGSSEDPSNPGPNPDPSETAGTPRRPDVTSTEPDSGSGSNDRDRPRTPNVTVPDRPAPDVHYYGDDLGFSEELDFGDLEPVTEGPTDEELEDGPIAGAVEVSSLERVLNEDVVLRSVAGGLIFLTLALHLRRWSLEA